MSTTSDFRTDTEAALAPTVEGEKKPPTDKGGGKKPWRWRWFALIALIILIVGGSAGFLVPYLHTTLSASAATVTVTPTSQHLTSTYTITAVTTKPSAAQKQVGARLLTSTMTKSVTVKATGKGHQDATRATGMLYITSLSGDFPAGWYRVTSNSGVVIMFRVPTSIPARIGSLTVEVQAEPFGPSGNIPAYDIDGQFSVSDVTFYMQNTQPFTGGQDAFDYTYVTPSDISVPSGTLTNQLTPDVQNAVRKQMQAQEQFTGDIQITSKINTNHQANDRANDVTVTVSVTAKAEVYKPVEAQSIAMNLLKNDAAARLGAGYTLVGETIAAPPTVETIGNNSTVNLKVKAEGVWVYHFGAAQLHSMAQTIAGKTQADTLTLLGKQQGVNKISIATSGGWGTALPITPGNITFNVQAVPGLKAT